MAEIPAIACLGCGATKDGPTGDPTDVAPATRCGDCPPWTCETCGSPCSATALCVCWISLDGLPLADIKGLLAAADLSVDVPNRGRP